MSEKPQPPLGSRFTDALAVAAEIHRGQTRKGTRIAYIAHILVVTSLALEHGATEDEAIAALLHDAIEDAPEALGAAGVRSWIQFKFGPEVLRIVNGCTDAGTHPKPPWRARKENYIARIAHKDAATILVSAADKLHNVRAILIDFRNEGLKVFSRFNPDAGVEGTIGYYRGLVSAFRSALNSLAMRGFRG